MYLILEKRIVAHGDDDYYKFHVLEPIGVVDTKEDAQKYLTTKEAEYKAQLVKYHEDLDSFKKSWEKTHPRPVGNAFITNIKWGKIKNTDITPEMRMERENRKSQNKQIEWQNKIALSKWLRELESVEEGYLCHHKPPEKRHLITQKIEKLNV